MRALGTNYEDFYRTLIDQLAVLTRKGGVPDEEQLNFMLAVIKGIEPRDQVEAMMASQMAAIQSLTMTMARRLATTETIPQQDSASNALNKLARTFAAQVEVLKRYRTGGEQKVTVHHVSVNEGGQAIVGTVNTGGGVSRNRTQPHERQISIPEKPTLSGDFKAHRQALPGARGHWLEGLPVPRRSRRRTERQAKRQLSPRVLHQGSTAAAPRCVSAARHVSKNGC